MKIKIYIFITLSFLVLFISGCYSMTKPYSYSYENDANRAAKLEFTYGASGILFVDMDGRPHVEAEGAYLQYVMLPSGRAMSLRVYIYWDNTLEGNRRRGIFECPPLEAGGEYRLRCNLKTIGIFIKRPIGDITIILEKKNQARGIIGTRYDTVYSQKVPPLPQ